MTTKLRQLAVFLCAACAFPASTSGQILSSDFQSCMAKPTQSLQRSCLDELARRMNNPPAAPSGSTALNNAWRLLRTADPTSGAVHVAIMRTVDSARSDADLAGLMLRCASQGIETVLVVTQPFARNARPSVTLRTGTDSRRFDASALQAGDIVLLPREAYELLRQSGPRSELAVDIGATSNSQIVRGVIPLAGFSEALVALQAACGHAPKM